MSISILAISRLTPRTLSAPTSALSSAGIVELRAVKVGAGNQASRRMPPDIVVIAWPDAMVSMC